MTAIRYTVRFERRSSIALRVGEDGSVQVRAPIGCPRAQIEAALEQARACKGKPFAIIMKTVKGKGVSFMENQVGWHGKAPNKDEYEIAMKELEENLEVLENG